MFNRALVKNSKRVYLTIAIVVTAILVVGFSAIFFTLKTARDQNYNGNFSTVDGVVERAKFFEGSDVWFLFLWDDDNAYCTSDVAGMFDWSTLADREVTIYIPAKQIVVDPPLVLGLKVDGELVIDPAETAKRMRSANTDLIVLMILIMVFAVVCGGLFVWRLHVFKYNDFSLAEAYARWVASATPSNNANRFVLAIVAVWAGILLLCSAMYLDLPESARPVTVWIPVATTVAGIIATFFVARWAKRKTDEFFAQHFPFDFGDFSLWHLPKRMREKSEKQYREFDEKHPDTYGDGGNAVWAKFDETGVDLFHELEKNPRKKRLPSASEVFFGEESDETDTPKPFLHLTYDRLNFEAVAFFHLTSANALVVVVKSRIDGDDDEITDKLYNDLHFCLDINFLNTLRKFNAHVENLDYILRNFAEMLATHKKKYIYPENFDEKSQRT